MITSLSYRTGSELVTSLRASSVGAEASRRLRDGVTGHVHSVFDGALNIVYPRGIVSVVARPKGRGPLNVVLSGRSPPPLKGLAEPGSNVSLERDLLRIGDRLHVGIGRARLYTTPARFPRRTLNLGRIRKNISVAEDLIRTSGHLDGLGGLVFPLASERLPERLAQSPFVPRALPEVFSLSRRLREGDMAGAVHTAKNLIGLGVGLTPSGDDLLSGVLVALVLGSKNGLNTPDGIQKFASEVANGALGRTTLLSQNYLEQASAGCANEVVQDFVEDLYTGSPDQLRRSLAHLIDFGATSGTDIALGATLGVSIAIGEQVMAS